MGAHAVQRAKERVAELAGRGSDVTTFFRGAAEAIDVGAPSTGAPSWFTLDPASLLITSYSCADEVPAEVERRILTWEYQNDEPVEARPDQLKAADIARSDRGLTTLHEAAGHDVAQSFTYACLQEFGLEQEVRVALRNRAGETWGMLSLVREQGLPHFSRDELAFLGSVAPDLARGVQRGILVGEAADPDWPEAPGLLVLHEDWGVESMTPGVQRWLARLPGGRDGRLPTSVITVASQALRTTAHRDDVGELAIARVLTDDGCWVVLHGAALVAAGRRRAAVIVEPAHPARISPLLMAAYGLTDREQDVARRVLQGDSTKEIAAALFVSPHTVQQHLTNIFEKTRVRSRRELVGKVFLAHYDPRVRDNDRRQHAGQHLRGGPFPLHAPSS
jgi:DNA-binding CsgD family transcriptional regulator